LRNIRPATCKKSRGRGQKEQPDHLFAL
jgi:hypothetical protein